MPEEVTQTQLPRVMYLQSDLTWAVLYDKAEPKVEVIFLLIMEEPVGCRGKCWVELSLMTCMVYLHHSK